MTDPRARAEQLEDHLWYPLNGRSVADVIHYNVEAIYAALLAVEQETRAEVEAELERLRAAEAHHRVYAKQIAEALQPLRELRSTGEPQNSDWREIHRQRAEVERSTLERCAQKVEKLLPSGAAKPIAAAIRALGETGV